ncbi:MAG: CotH kinase family protein, partial [Verrucomicrobiota bacterium]
MKIPVSAWLILILAVPFSSLWSSDVIISEFSADNRSLEDEDTDSPDWIEVRNLTASPINLKGWFLTNTQENQRLWTFDDFTVEANGYKLIFASGKDRTRAHLENPLTHPHTNFRLPDGGGYLALIEPDGTSIASEYTYPEMDRGTSYGRVGEREGFYYPGTPGAVNGSAPAANGFTPEVEFSHSGGFVNEGIELTLEVPDHPDAVIYITKDGSAPKTTLFATKYTGPVAIDRTITVRARASIANHLPGRTTTASFTLMNESLSQFAETGRAFESNLPIIYLDSFGANIDGQRQFQPGIARVFIPDPETGRASILGLTEYDSHCSFHLRGESSAGFGQKSYALELQDEEGEDRDKSLLGMPAESDWALYGPWSEKTLMRNKLVYDWMRELRGDDGTSVRSAFCELFFNQKDTDQVGYDTYKGIYLLIEKIKRGRDRVPVENLNALTVDPEAITGGYIFRKDKADNGKTQMTSRYAGGLQSFDPDVFNSEQKTYLQNYINEFESALAENDFSQSNGYPAFIDTGSFIDAQWMVEVSKQVDGYVFSTYFHKPRGGKIIAGPTWDFNISLGNADYGSGESPEGWLYNNLRGDGGHWYPRLHRDPAYKVAYWDRYWHMRYRFLSEEAIEKRIDSLTTYLLDNETERIGNREPDSVQNPVARHFRRYPHLGQRQWPNPPAETQVEAYQDEIEYMKDWLFERLEWIDDKSNVVDRKVHRAPIFSHYDGLASETVELTITLHKGTLFTASKYPQAPVYFTLDGRDPRDPDGLLRPEAMLYENPISIESTAKVAARMLNGETWSPLTTATIIANAVSAAEGQLVISEVMYHPSDPTNSELAAGYTDDDEFEYLELTNIGNQTVDLATVSLVDGVRFEFLNLDLDDRLLESGASILLVSNEKAFRLRHPEVPTEQILGVFAGGLSNGGERIALESGGVVVHELSYDDTAPWPTEADGGGQSLVLTDPDQMDIAGWSASSS